MPPDARPPEAPPAPPRLRDRRRRSLPERLLAHWLRPKAAGGGEAADPAAVSSDEAAEALVDQAEAFATLRVGDVMTPRADIAALELSTPLADVVQRFVEVEHSRMPIYRETLDDPLGVAHIKDLFKLIAPTETAPDRAPRSAWREPVLHRLRREALYVPASMRAADLLIAMRAQRIHMALVIDEYGGTDGLVTLEDLVEAVVGEIDDEHDEAAAAALTPRPGGVYEADGRAPVERLEAALGVSLTPPDAEEEVDTLAGLVATLAGRVPRRGEVIVHPSGFEFEVLDADPRRIRRLRVRPPASPEPEATPAEPAAAAPSSR